MGIQKLFGKPCILTPENKKAVVGIFRIGMYLPALGGEEEIIPAAVFLKEIVYIVIVAYIQLVPVIKPRTLQLFVVYLKAQGTDKM